MKITIETDGNANNTVILFDDKRMQLSEFSFSLRANGKAKLQMKKFDPVSKKVEFLSFYGPDFLKFDEANGEKNPELIGKENYRRDL